MKLFVAVLVGTIAIALADEKIPEGETAIVAEDQAEAGSHYRHYGLGYYRGHYYGPYGYRWKRDTEAADQETAASGYYPYGGYYRGYGYGRHGYRWRRDVSEVDESKTANDIDQDEAASGYYPYGGYYRGYGYGRHGYRWRRDVSEVDEPAAAEVDQDKAASYYHLHGGYYRPHYYGGYRWRRESSSDGLAAIAQTSEDQLDGGESRGRWYGYPSYYAYGHGRGKRDTTNVEATSTEAEHMSEAESHHYYRGPYFSYPYRWRRDVSEDSGSQDQTGAESYYGSYYRHWPSHGYGPYSYRRW